jgi:hypothetical protein
MPLSAVEKQVGRAFRAARQAALDARNEQDPPGVLVLPWWRVIRHLCPAERSVSIGITLREVYETSPLYRACYCGEVAADGPDFPHDGCDGSRVVAAVARFAFIWKEGKCSGSGCGLVARTCHGRFVVAADRLPEHGRTHGERRQASPHP